MLGYVFYSFLNKSIKYKMLEKNDVSFLHETFTLFEFFFPWSCSTLFGVNKAKWIKLANSSSEKLILL